MGLGGLLGEGIEMSEKLVQAESGASQSGLRSSTQGSEFTRGPWKLTGHVFADQNRFDIGSVCLRPNAMETEANAARIVHCVNLHDELVEALDGLVSHVESDRAWYADQVRAFAIQIDRARSALAKAKGAA